MATTGLFQGSATSKIPFLLSHRERAMFRITERHRPARILVHLGRYVEAEPLLRKALDIRQKRKRPGHWKTAKTESVLGACLTGLGQYEEAETLLLNCYPVIAKDRGPSHRRTAEAITRIVKLYETWGKPDKAAAWRAKLPKTHKAESAKS